MILFPVGPGTFASLSSESIGLLRRECGIVLTGLNAVGSEAFCGSLLLQVEVRKRRGKQRRYQKPANRGKGV